MSPLSRSACVFITAGGIPPRPNLSRPRRAVAPLRRREYPWRSSADAGVRPVPAGAVSVVRVRAGGELPVLLEARRMMLAGRFALLLVFTAIGLTGPMGSSSSPRAEDIRFVRIGTGPIGGTYFPVGGLIANVISGPPGSRACDLGGNCGVPGLIAAAVSTQGSLDNVTEMGV